MNPREIAQLITEDPDVLNEEVHISEILEIFMGDVQKEPALRLLSTVPSDQLKKVLRRVRRTAGFKQLLNDLQPQDLLFLRRSSSPLFFFLLREMLSNNPEMEEKLAELSKPKQQVGRRSLVSPRKQTAISTK